MAATDVSPFPIKNLAFRAHLLLLDADGDPVTGGGGLDAEISKDGGAFTDCTNAETEIGNGWYYVELTATEMNADTVIVVLKSSTTGAKTGHMIVHPVALTELSAVPAFGAAGAGIEEALAWLLAVTRNRMETEDDEVRVYKDDGTTVLGTAAITTPSAGVLRRGEFA